MLLKIFTFPLDPSQGGFDSEPLSRFCLDKEVFEMSPHFFLREGQPYWTVCVRYRVAGEPGLRPKTKKNELPVDWGERERLLYQHLKAWRGQEAERRGEPHFVIARNRDLVAVVEALPRSKTELRALSGFGPKKVSQYGPEILGIVQAFLTNPPKTDG